MTTPAAPTKRELAQSIIELETMLADAIAALAQQIEDLTPPDPPPPPLPRRWAEQATTEQWEALQDWVNDLNDSYSLHVGLRHP